MLDGQHGVSLLVTCPKTAWWRWRYVDVANVTEPTDTKYLPLALHMKGFKPHLILQPLKSESLQHRVEWT